MAKLTSAQRNSLPKRDFIYPQNREYPIPDASHARNALARAAQSGSPSKIAKVKAAVHKKFPGIK
jgi:hypothetical protein